MTVVEQAPQPAPPTEDHVAPAEAALLADSDANGEAYDQELDAGLHSWFKPEQFVDPDFNADSYVGDLRGYVPLETLKSELDKHLSFLKNRLVEVINEDYSDFVSLSTKLVNVDGAVVRMKKPLGELKEKLEGVQGTVQGELDQLQEQLQRRKDVAEARGILDLMQDTAHVASKVEKLLVEVEQTHGNLHKEADLDARTRLLERVASEVSRLTFYCNKGEGLPFIAEMEPRVATYRAHLNTHLQEALDVSLQNRKNAAIFHCFHAYSALGDSSGAEETVRAAIVAPMVKRVVAAHSSSGPRPGGDMLGALLGALSEEITKECGFLLDIALNPQSGLHSFNFLSNSILREAHAALVKDLSRAFSPGVPDAFLSNYRAAIAFIESLEGHCRSMANLEAFRSSEEYSAFMKRWNLSVYFSLRFQDIAGGMDTILASPDLALVEGKATASSGEAHFAVCATDSLWAALHRCLGKEVFVDAIADKLVRLVLQLLGRYRYWMSSGLRFRQSHISAGPGGKVSQPKGANLSFDWALKIGLEELSLLRLDVCTLVDRLQGVFCSEMESRMQPLGLPGANMVVDAARRNAEAIAALGPEIDSAITALTADKCVQVLKQLRGITATYRLTTRPMPTRPSHYVAGVLVALRQFRELPQAAGLPAAVSKGLVTMCAERVSRSYADMANDLLTTMKKTQDSLKRLKKGRAQKPDTVVGGSGEQATDQEKITLQLFLDVQEYGRQLQSFELAPAELPEYQGLWATVAPADRKEIVILPADDE
mmetsp:Transcript_36950/g.104270  ORF Transcript_36950/g.104270 Transcript_36950/m.104270 type:complete len:768 (-) Transcript_36950:202-2505(-)